MAELSEIKTPQFDMKKVGASTVVTPKESLTYKNSEDFQSIVSALISQYQSQIIIDGRAMAFMDSKALETLLYLHDRLKERGGVLKIASLNAVCRDILIATRFINAFHIYQDVQEAIRMGT